MKNKKTLIGLVIGLVCLVLCLVLVLTMCNSDGNSDPTQPDTTADATDTTGATVDTVSPTEQTTVPVEETTAPTVETQPAGNNKPGGGGYTPIQPTTPEATEPEETQPAVEVDAPGTENNAYYETANKLPGLFTTVKIPANSSVYYLLQTQGDFLIVEDKDAAVVLGEKTYKPENGVITVPLAGLESPVALQFANNAAQEKAFAVKIVGPVGSASNPEVLQDVAKIQVKLEQGNESGRFYTWTAEKTGLLLWGFDSVQPQSVGGKLTVTVGDETMSLANTDTDPLWAYVTAGDELTIQLAATADANGAYPAAEIAVSSVFVQREEIKVTQIPTSLQTKELAAGSLAYYNLSGVSNTTVTINDANVFVICNNITYGPDENGAVCIEITGESADLVIGNTDTVKKVFTLEIASADSGETTPTDPEETTAPTEPSVPEETTAPTEPSVPEETTAPTEPSVPEETTAPTEPVVQELMIGEKNNAVLGENSANAVFNWTAFLDGSLKLTMGMENYSGWYMQVNNLTTGQSAGPIDSDGFENALTVDVTTGDELQILVNTHEYGSENTPAGEVAFYASFVSGTGTQEDPYSVLGTDFSVPVAAGQTVYCSGRFNDMIAEVYGENITVQNDGKTVVSEWGYASMPITGGDFFNPPVLTLTNTGTDTVVNVVMSYPLGSSNNPEDMMIGGKNTATLEAKDEDGYYFRYVSYADGVLKIAMDPANQTEWSFCVQNSTQNYFGDLHYSDSDPYVTVETLEVKTGDEIIVQVNTYNSADMWDTPAGEVSFDTTFISGTGTQEDPYAILGMDADIAVPAGQTVYCSGRFNGMIANIFGENVTVENDGKTQAAEWGFAMMEITGGDMFNPAVFTLTNTGEDATYNIQFTYPIGSNENPEDLFVGEQISASIGAEDENGYYYQFQSSAEGKLTITMSAENLNGWFFTVENRTQNSFGDWHYSDDDPLVTSETISVAEGDTIVVQVNTYNPENMWEHLAGEVIFESSFVYGSGTQEDPYMIQGLNVDIPVSAGQTVYCSGRFSGMIANVYGEHVTVENDGKTQAAEWGFAMMEITGGDFFNPPVFTLTNTGEDATYNIQFTYPIGSNENPEDLFVGEQITASIGTEDENGYYYRFEAYVDGALTIAMSPDNATGWFFAVENRTQGSFGDWHYSDDDPLVTSETISVTEGDTIVVQINTYNPENMWEHIAGEVSFNTAFVAGSGTQEDPYQVQGLELDIAVEAGQTVYCTGRYSGMVLTLTGDNATVSCNGNTATSDNGTATCLISGGDMWTPPVFTLTNSGEATSYHLRFNYPLGTMDNPDTLATGQNTVTFTAGSSEYYFQWEAPAAGKLTITINDGNANGWQYCVNNMTSYQYGESHTSGDATPVMTETWTVSEGDEIQLRICTYDPNDPWEIPAGEVSFTVTFE